MESQKVALIRALQEISSWYYPISKVPCNSHTFYSPAPNEPTLQNRRSAQHSTMLVRRLAGHPWFFLL